MGRLWATAGLLAILLAGATAPVFVGGQTTATLTWTNAADTDLAGTEVGFWQGEDEEPELTFALSGENVKTDAGAVCSTVMTSLLDQLGAGTWTLRLRHWDKAANHSEWSDPVEFTFDNTPPGKPIGIRITIVTQ